MKVYEVTLRATCEMVVRVEVERGTPTRIEEAIQAVDYDPLTPWEPVGNDEKIIRFARIDNRRLG